MALTLKTKKLSEAREGIPVHEVVKGSNVHINIVAPEGTRREWKVASARLGKSVSDMVKEAVDEYLARRSNDQMAK